MTADVSTITLAALVRRKGSRRDRPAVLPRAVASRSDLRWRRIFPRRASTLRSRISRSRRSSSATVIAPVHRLAGKVGQLPGQPTSPLYFLMFEAHRTSLRVETTFNMSTLHRPAAFRKVVWPSHRVLAGAVMTNRGRGVCALGRWQRPDRKGLQRATAGGG